MEKESPPQRSRGGYLEALLSSCPVAILAIDATGVIQFANKEALNIFERDVQEIVGESIVSLYENMEVAKETNRRLYKNGGMVHDHDSRIRTKTGKILPVRISASHLKDSAGNYAGAVGYFETYRPWAAAEIKLKAQVQELEAKLDKWKDRVTPVFELYPGIAGVVIVGSLDVARFDRITANLLNHMKDTETDVAIIDLAAAVADDDVAASLVKVVRTIYLMGATCMLAGVKPALAQAIEPLVEDISLIESYSTLHVALEAALESIGLKICERD